MTGAWKRAAALAALPAACRGVTAGVDCRLCARGKEPVFAAVDHDVFCIDCCRGLGDTIALSYDGCVQQSDFSRGWGFPA